MGLQILIRRAFCTKQIGTATCLLQSGECLFISMIWYIFFFCWNHNLKLFHWAALVDCLQFGATFLGNPRSHENSGEKAISRCERGNPWDLLVTEDIRAKIATGNALAKIAAWWRVLLDERSGSLRFCQAAEDCQGQEIEEKQQAATWPAISFFHGNSLT